MVFFNQIETNRMIQHILAGIQNKINDKFRASSLHNIPKRRAYFITLHGVTDLAFCSKYFTAFCNHFLINLIGNIPSFGTRAYPVLKLKRCERVFNLFEILLVSLLSHGFAFWSGVFLSSSTSKN